jgi:tetratricopeptide (TPR) repeat protein
VRNVGTERRQGRRTLPSASGKVGRLLRAGSRSLEVKGDLGAARRAFSAAAVEAETQGDPVALGEAALGLGGLWLSEHRSAVDAARVRAWRARALQQLDPATDLALRLRVREAAEADYPLGATGRILPALDAARARADPTILAEALRHALHGLLGPAHSATRLALADELVTVAAASSRPLDATLALMWRTIALFLAADPHADRALSEAHAHANASGHLAVVYVLSAIDVMLQIRAGRLSEAERLADACAERGAAVGDPDVSAWHAAHVGTIRWFQGRAEELVPRLRDLVSSPTLSEPDDSLLAGLAAAAVQRLRRTDLNRLPASSVWLVTLFAVVEAAHLLADVDTAAEAYQLLRPFAALPAMASFAVICFGSVEHSLGVASMTAGDLDRAVDHLRRALVRDEALGHRPAHLMSCAVLAVALDRRGREGDAEEARALIADVGRGAPTLGMAAWLARWGFESVVAPATVEGSSCVREGRGWRLSAAGRSAWVADSLGMGYLAELISNPGKEIAAVDLARSEASSSPVDFAASHELLDDAARAEYRARLVDLSADLQEAEANADLERAARLHAEYDWLVTEVEHATGFGGRSRQFPSDNERARTAVRKAIKRALAAIGKADEQIRREVEASTVTGSRCTYRPRSPDP